MTSSLNRTATVRGAVLPPALRKPHASSMSLDTTEAFRDRNGSGMQRLAKPHRPTSRTAPYSVSGKTPSSRITLLDRAVRCNEKTLPHVVQCASCYNLRSSREMLMRRLVCLLMLMLLPLHGFAAQTGALHEHAYNIAHELDHANGVSHHHAPDGTIYYDQSDESVQHASELPAFSQVAALPSMLPTHPVMAFRSIVSSPPVLLIPDGIVTLPIRPPRTVV